MNAEKSRNLKGAGLLAAVGFAGILLLGGCKKQAQNNAASGTAGSSPAAAPASAPVSATPGSAIPPSAASAANQTAAGPAPAPPPAPPPPPTPQVYTVARGTRLVARISQTLSGKTSNVGDSFRGTLVQSVRVNGVPVLKAGTPVVGTVIAAKGQGKFKGEGTLAIQLHRVGPYTVTTSYYEKTVNSKGKRSAGLIGGGGGGGALIGALAGGGKGALIGGLVGAGAGTAGAAYTGNTNVSIPAESVITFRLTSPATVTLKP